MLHDACENNPNARCYIDGKCQRKFPKNFTDTTIVNDNGYPTYKRSADNVMNAYVVPYNAYLLQKMDCHINVEYCSSVKAIKYLFKYIFKNDEYVEA